MEGAVVRVAVVNEERDRLQLRGKTMGALLR